MSAVDWNAIGTAVGAVVIGVGSFVAGKGRRQVESAANTAESAVITMLREEVTRLSLRVSAVESREGKMVRHIYRLEGLMRGSGLEPPPFDVDGEPIKAGGTD